MIQYHVIDLINWASQAFQALTRLSKLLHSDFTIFPWEASEIRFFCFQICAPIFVLFILWKTVNKIEGWRRGTPVAGVNKMKIIKKFWSSLWTKMNCQFLIYAFDLHSVDTFELAVTLAPESYPGKPVLTSICSSETWKGGGRWGSSTIRGLGHCVHFASLQQPH